MLQLMTESCLPFSFTDIGVEINIICLVVIGNGHTLNTERERHKAYEDINHSSSMPR